MNQPPPAETPTAATLDLTVMRQAQRAWARTDWPVRLGIIRRARQLIATIGPEGVEDRRLDAGDPIYQ